MSALVGFIENFRFLGFAYHHRHHPRPPLEGFPLACLPAGSSAHRKGPKLSQHP